MIETHLFSGSAALVEGAYDPDTSTLTLWFTSSPRKAYQYRHVPLYVWQELKLAGSAGEYVRHHIRGRYSTLP